MSTTLGLMSNEYTEMVGNYNNIKKSALDIAFLSKQVQIIQGYKLNASNISKHLNNKKTQIKLDLIVARIKPIEDKKFNQNMTARHKAFAIGGVTVETLR